MESHVGSYRVIVYFWWGCRARRVVHVRNGLVAKISNRNSTEFRNIGKERWPMETEAQKTLRPFHSQVQKAHSPNLSKRMNEWCNENWYTIIIFRLSKLWKAKFFILCDGWRGCRGNLKLITLGNEVRNVGAWSWRKRKHRVESSLSNISLSFVRWHERFPRPKAVCFSVHHAWRCRRDYIRDNALSAGHEARRVANTTRRKQLWNVGQRRPRTAGYQEPEQGLSQVQITVVGLNDYHCSWSL